MKMMDRDDLIFVLSAVDDSLLFTEDDIKRIFELYGDEYCCDGNRVFEKVEPNKTLANIRKMFL